MNNRKEQELFQKMKADLGKLDGVYKPEVPKKEQLQDHLLLFKAKQKRAFRRELLAFFITALMIVTSSIVFIFKLAPIFMAIQAVAFLAIPFISIAEKKRSRKWEQVPKYEL